MLDQIQQLTKMGSMEDIINMLPGDHAQKKQMMAQAPDQKRIKRMEAILLSMTKKERAFPQILDGSRRRRISQGSGTRPDEVNTLLKQYDMMKKVMKKGGMMQKASNLMGGMGKGGFPPMGGGMPGGLGGPGGGFPGFPGR
jgi:signal recognition particle subunit SRP54